MERTTWTDERFDDFSRRMDAGFARVDADIRELRVELRGGFAEAHRRADTHRGEVRGEIDALGADLRGEIEAFRMTILRVGGGIMIGLVGVIAAILARGV